MVYNNFSFRILARVVSPGGLLLLTAWALQRDEPVRNAMAPYALYFCFGALAAAALLSWYHNYGRVLCVSAVVGLAAWSCCSVQAIGFEIPRLIPAVLLPMNFVLFLWLTERGVLTVSGLLKFAVIVAQVAGVLFFAGNAGYAWIAHIAELHPAAGWTWMPWIGLFSFWIAAPLLLFLAFRRQTKIALAVLWALAAVFVGMNQSHYEGVFLYSGAAGLILLLGVLEHGYDIAYLDELTGLPSRRAFNEAIRLLRGHFSIAMCDVDHFKKLNDTYGHDAGDQVLKMIASRLSNVRGGGRVFRFGGEEFAILFQKRTAEEVEHIVEALRDAVARSEFVLRDAQRNGQRQRSEAKPESGIAVKITISIGFAGRSESRPTPEMVLKASDDALYLAKESGRNCVRLAQAPGSKETA